MGKTNLLSRLSNDEFSDEFVSTIGGACAQRYRSSAQADGSPGCFAVEFLTTVVEVDGEIWDTAGQERFRSILSAYCESQTRLLLKIEVALEVTGLFGFAPPA